MTDKENGFDYYGKLLELRGRGHLPRSTAPDVWQRVFEDRAVAGDRWAQEILYPSDPLTRAWRQQIYGVQEGEEQVVLGNPWEKLLKGESSGRLTPQRTEVTPETDRTNDPRIHEFLDKLADDPRTYQDAQRFIRGLEADTERFIQEHNSQGEELASIIRRNNRDLAIMYLEGVIQIRDASRRARR